MLCFREMKITGKKIIIELNVTKSGISTSRDPKPQAPSAPEISEVNR